MFLQAVQVLNGGADRWVTADIDFAAGSIELAGYLDQRDAFDRRTPDEVVGRLEMVAAEDRILAEPACTIAVSELADSSVNFVLRPWVNAADYWGVKFDMTERIKKRFDEEGISIPFPQQDVHVHQVGAAS